MTKMPDSDNDTHSAEKSSEPPDKKSFNRILTDHVHPLPERIYDDEQQKASSHSTHHMFALHFPHFMHSVKHLLHAKHGNGLFDSKKQENIPRADNQATAQAKTSKQTAGVTVIPVKVQKNSLVQPLKMDKDLPTASNQSYSPAVSAPSTFKESNNEMQKLRQRYGKPCLLLGKGTYGNCWLVKRQADKKMFAVKEFRKKRHEESEAQYIKKLTSEFCIASVLHHPNVIETLDIIFERGHVYEVMELCEGGDLFDAITAYTMTESEMNCVFKQLIQGVMYLHQQGVCHRDLKPENCMFDANNHLKIIDFGCAQVVRLPYYSNDPEQQKEQHPQLCTGQCGSGPYMAPEEFYKEPYDGMKVDVWACGIMYLTMAFHRFPWKTATMSDPQYNQYCQSRQTFSLMNRLAPPQKLLMLRMLDSDPMKRTTIFEVFEDEWVNSIAVCDEVNLLHHHGCVQHY